MAQPSQMSLEQRAERNREIEQQVHSLYIQGYKRPMIAHKLKLSMHVVDNMLLGVACNEEQRREKHIAALKKGKKLRHPWLDPMDDANIEGYWVPTPAEIKQRAAAVRRAMLTGDYSEIDADDRRLRCPKCGRKLTALRRGYCTPCTKQRKQERKAARAMQQRMAS